MKTSGTARNFKMWKYKKILVDKNSTIEKTAKRAHNLKKLTVFSLKINILIGFSS